MSTQMALAPPSPSRLSMSSMSSTTSTTHLPPYDASFKPATTLHIHSKGMRLVRFPMPSSELSIPVYDADGEVKYVSKRAKKCSGDAVLLRIVNFDANQQESKSVETWQESDETWHGVPVTETKYFFGPGRDPVVEILGQEGGVSLDMKDDNEKRDSALILDEKAPAQSIRSNMTGATLAPGSDSFKIESGWTTRACTFSLVSPSTGVKHTFSWEHERAKTPSGEKAKLLVLLWHAPSSGLPGQSSQKVKIAQLVRSASTRTPGTRPSYAGNGGMLELSSLVSSKANAGTPRSASDVIYGMEKSSLRQDPLIDEGVVLATCMSMLKKEMDRRRLFQTMVIVSAASN